MVEADVFQANEWWLARNAPVPSHTGWDAGAITDALNAEMRGPDAWGDANLADVFEYLH